jgi:hypothetical protein
VLPQLHRNNRISSKFRWFSRKKHPAYYPYDEQQEPAGQPVARQLETTETTPTTPPPQYAAPTPQLSYEKSDILKNLFEKKSIHTSHMMNSNSLLDNLRDGNHELDRQRLDRPQHLHHSIGYLHHNSQMLNNRNQRHIGYQVNSCQLKEKQYLRFFCFNQ